MTYEAAGNLPDGCTDPSDLDYYERVNGPDEDPQDDDEDDTEEMDDDEYLDWLDWVRRQENGYQDAARLGS